MNILAQVAANKTLLIPVGAWLVAQALKTIIQALREKRLDLRYTIAAGGMPSAHASLVCALATTAGIVHGVDSAAFGISAILAMVVMYDATGVTPAV